VNLLFIDNFDSFSFNIVHALQATGSNVEVKTHLELDEVNWDLYDGLVIGPGPGTPSGSGDLLAFMERASQRKPLLGICLGMQAMGELAGAELVHAPVPMHGKPSMIAHAGGALFASIPNPMRVGRYHSLVLQSLSGTQAKILAETTEGECMAIEWKVGPMVHYGVQFHPESILTPEGQALIQNWVNTIGKGA
jgi:anthranilate synthase/aminodeoxychorismate synthase-like glutamine amidotransferase